MMIWLDMCGQGLTEPVILEDGTMDHERYIDEVLPIALKSGNKMLGNNWTYQQDGAQPHTHHLSQKWCAEHFPALIPKNRWPPNSLDLCILDYSLWNELAKPINWNRATAKVTLIEEIKRAVKEVGHEKILNSVLDFTARLRLIKRNRRDYIR